MPHNQERVLEVLEKLCKHGWVSLRSMSVLLGYASPGCMYQRQGSRSAISTIKVGHIQRVYEETVLEVLKAHQNTADAELVLSLYTGVRKNHEQSLRIT